MLAAQDGQKNPTKFELCRALVFHKLLHVKITCLLPPDFGQSSGLDVYYIKAPDFTTFNSPASLAEFSFPKITLIMSNDCIPTDRNILETAQYVLAVLRERYELVHVVVQTLSHQTRGRSEPCPSLMVPTQYSTTIPVYVFQSLQNSGIRFSWLRTCDGALL